MRQWDTAHLSAAASFWSDTAVQWEDVFTRTSREVHWPGSTPWEGAAAGAAQSRAVGDRRKVLDLADRLHEASAVARKGAARVQVAKHGVLAAVKAAEEAGFTVEEDFSLTTYRAGDDAIAAAEARGRELAERIRSNLNELLAADGRVAADMGTAADEVRSINFADADDSDSERDPTIQAIDNRIIEENPPASPPTPDPPPGPPAPIRGADDVRRMLDPLPTGQKPGIKEVWDAGTIRRMWDYLTRSSSDKTPRPNYSGQERILPDGTVIGLRKSSDGWGDTIDVWYPDGSKGTKVHSPYGPYFPPLIVEPPQVPAAATGEPAPIPPPQWGHPPAEFAPPSIFDPNGLPPWLQNPSTPGIHVPAQPPTIMPGVVMPNVPSSGPSVDEDFNLLPEVGHQLADAGADAAKAVGAAIVIGAAALAALVGVPAGG